MATVELNFAPVPEHVRTARLVAAAVGRRLGVDEELVGDIKLAVGEACARAVGLNSDTDEHVRLTLCDDEPGFLLVTVADCGAERPDQPRATAALGSELTEDGAVPAEFRLAVLAGLVGDVDVARTDSTTTVSLRWPLAAPGEPRLGGDEPVL